jgi:hypothetical protein
VAVVVAVAIAAVVVVSGVMYLAQLAVTRADRVGSATAATYEARLSLERARADGLQALAEQEKRRADALDDLLATLDRGGDPATARERVLQLWQVQRANAAAAANAARALPAPPAAASPTGDNLLRPGE